MKFCPFCRTRFDPTVNFCPTCGQPLAWVPPVAQPPTVRKVHPAWYCLLLVPCLFGYIVCNGSPNASQTYASAPPVQVEGGSPDSQNKSNPKERPELVYCQKVGDVAQELEDADDAIITVTTQGEEDSSVISDADWVGQVDDMASKFNDAADKAYAISPVPPKCKKLHRLVLRLADESRLVGKDFKKAVHEISVPEMNVATNHLRHQYELAGQVVKELGRLKSKLGL